MVCCTQYDDMHYTMQQINYSSRFCCRVTLFVTWILWWVSLLASRCLTFAPRHLRATANAGTRTMTQHLRCQAVTCRPLACARQQGTSNQSSVRSSVSTSDQQSATACRSLAQSSIVYHPPVSDCPVDERTKEGPNVGNTKGVASS